MTGDIPQNVNFVIKAALARGFVEAVGVEYQSRIARAAHTTADIATEARDFVVEDRVPGVTGCGRRAPSNEVDRPSRLAFESVRALAVAENGRLEAGRFLDRSPGGNGIGMLRARRG